MSFHFIFEKGLLVPGKRPVRKAGRAPRPFSLASKSGLVYGHLVTSVVIGGSHSQGHRFHSFEIQRVFRGHLVAECVGMLEHPPGRNEREIISRKLPDRAEDFVQFRNPIPVRSALTHLPPPLYLRQSRWRRHRRAPRHIGAMHIVIVIRSRHSSGS